MPRAKGGPKTRHRRKKRLKLAKGQYGERAGCFALRQNRSIKVRRTPIPDEKSETGFPRVMDCAYQRGGPGAWTDL